MSLKKVKQKRLKPMKSSNKVSSPKKRNVVVQGLIDRRGSGAGYHDDASKYKRKGKHVKDDYDDSWRKNSWMSNSSWFLRNPAQDDDITLDLPSLDQFAQAYIDENKREIEKVLSASGFQPVQFDGCKSTIRQAYMLGEIAGQAGSLEDQYRPMVMGYSGASGNAKYQELLRLSFEAGLVFGSETLKVGIETAGKIDVKTDEFRLIFPDFKAAIKYIDSVNKRRAAAKKSAQKEEKEESKEQDTRPPPDIQSEIDDEFEGRDDGPKPTDDSGRGSRSSTNERRKARNTQSTNNSTSSNAPRFQSDLLKPFKPAILNRRFALQPPDDILRQATNSVLLYVLENGYTQVWIKPRSSIGPTTPTGWVGLTQTFGPTQGKSSWQWAKTYSRAWRGLNEETGQIDTKRIGSVKKSRYGMTTILVMSTDHVIRTVDPSVVIDISGTESSGQGPAFDPEKVLADLNIKNPSLYRQMRSAYD